MFPLCGAVAVTFVSQATSRKEVAYPPGYRCVSGTS
jgi:hypothetical protein